VRKQYCKYVQCGLQEAVDSRELSDAMRDRILTFYRHKYKGGQSWHHDSILRELPYDMQVQNTAMVHPVPTAVWQNNTYDMKLNMQAVMHALLCRGQSLPVSFTTAIILPSG